MIFKSSERGSGIKKVLGMSLKRRGERIFQRAEWNTKSMDWKTETHCCVWNSEENQPNWKDKQQTVANTVDF